MEWLYLDDDVRADEHEREHELDEHEPSSGWMLIGPWLA
jgi:hypothetical protein